MTYGRMRAEERLLVEAAQARDVPLELVYDRDLHFGLDGLQLDASTLLLRNLSATRGYYTAVAAEQANIHTVNHSETARVCGDKALTSMALRRANVPTPDVRVSFDPEATIGSLEQIGYPAVMKPVQGSWARMVHRVESPREAEQLLEYREQMSNPLQQVHYVQSYVDKSAAGANRDLRAFVVGDETIAAIWRNSEHWVTNTARGATTENCPVTAELNELCLHAAEAVGGGILAIDLMETPEGLTVHEVNHTMEFRNSIVPTGVDIPGRMIEYLAEQDA